MRLPLPQYRKLVGPWYADPHIFGLRVRLYDGAPHLEVVDQGKLQQALWAIQESLVPGDQVGTDLHRSLERLRDSFVGVRIWQVDSRGTLG